MREWLSDGQRLIALAILVAAILFAWMNRYETLPGGIFHRNRLTNAMCYGVDECWFKNGSALPN